MSKLKNAVTKFWKDEEGLTATEYAVCAALVIVGLVAAFTGLGNAIKTRIDGLSGTIGGGS